MIEIKLLEIAGFNSAFEALRLPFDKECRSETYFNLKTEPAQFIPECFINNPAELKTFSAIKLNEKDLQLLKTLILRGDEHAKVLRGIIVWTKITAPIYWWWDLETYVVGHQRLMSGSTMNAECKNLTGEELQKVKGEIPFGREITKIDYFSYQTLRRIYFQRKEHRLPEFHQFCEWIETLPFANELITLE